MFDDSKELSYKKAFILYYLIWIEFFVEKNLLSQNFHNMFTTSNTEFSKNKNKNTF